MQVITYYYLLCTTKTGEWQTHMYKLKTSPHFHFSIYAANDDHVTLTVVGTKDE